MNCKFALCTFFILILTTSARSMAIFSSKPGEVETSPSLQLLLRNVGLGLITDPIFFRIKRRWDTVRSSPLFFALISDANGNNKQPSAQAVIKAVKLLRELS